MCFYNMTQNPGHSTEAYLPPHGTQSTVSKILTPCEILHLEKWFWNSILEIQAYVHHLQR